MGCCPSLFRSPQRQTENIENGNDKSVNDTAATADSVICPLTIPDEPVSASDITTSQPTEYAGYRDAPIQRSTPQAQAPPDPSIPSNIVDDNLAPCKNMRHRVAFDVDPYAISSTSITRQTDHPTSSGDLGDIWKCSMTIDPATSTEVAVKSIRITDIRNEQAIQKAKKRLRREVAVWIRLRHAHVLTLHGTVSDFGPLPALVSTWMHNGALNGLPGAHEPNYGTETEAFETGGGWLEISYGIAVPIHEQEVIHGDLTSTNVLIDSDGSAFLADFGLSVVLAESDRSARIDRTYRIQKGILDNGDSDVNFQKPNSHSDVFSLGCIMLHVFSGKLPFWWLRNVRQLFSARFKRIEPYQLEPSVTISHQHLDFMRKCWSAKPEVRPSTGDVASFVEDELARVPSLLSD
ncbi:kinase-like domain-containing protein [Suillus subaureus]|uniref:Kinase-like domain-containing protein n=1 Tax=Suillus subaureus TaxID=48587 RepID=A0A9P7E227_9AGAM|nr:kinase-like domain-containing protein [Suillus subaureus]KAG1808950.1 kinase-like domain-containing protein [Suillus subaureus]